MNKATLSWCAEHGDAAGSPVMEWHPGGGIHCTALSRRATTRPSTVGQTAVTTDDVKTDAPHTAAAGS
ncbi:hypothetical protein [Streptomyces erythrochromogenes]|uniref:hypothetical protein n=1 Tax=Streptomyces erythrochromogenes TaxID=285574 RepID=UPI00380EE6E5